MDFGFSGMQGVLHAMINLLLKRRQQTVPLYMIDALCQVYMFDVRFKEELGFMQ